MTVEIMELTLFVTDVDDTARFYQAAGLRLFCVDEPGYPRHFDGDLGFQLWAADALHPVSHVQMGFFFDDLAASVRQPTVEGAQSTCRLPNFVATHDPDGKQDQPRATAKDVNHANPGIPGNCRRPVITWS